MRAWKIGLLLPLLGFLAGCGSSSEDDLRAWMADQRAQARPHVRPIPPPKQFKPEAYDEAGAPDPFSRDKLVSVLKQDSGQMKSMTSALIAPELARRKEPLEAFPLDSMVMVGSLIQKGQPAALLKVNNLLYQIRIGNHLGLHYGRVTKITETEVTLREIVQDPVGEWVERTATLQLQEKMK